MEQGLGHLFITSISSHFFNKTDYEQDLFKNVIVGIEKINLKMLAGEALEKFLPIKSIARFLNDYNFA